MKNQNPFERALNTTERRIDNLTKQLEVVRIFYSMGKMKQVYDSSLRLEEAAEKAVLMARELPAYTGNPQARMEIENVIRLTTPIEIGFTIEGWFCLKIPALLPKKEKGSVDYLRKPLYLAMQDFFTGKNPVRYNDCVIIYRHVYDASRPERKYRDHDNIEINFVTDTVALYVMPDDSPQFCTHYYCSAEGDSDRTEIYVVPKNQFCNWFYKEKYMSKEGEKLYEKRPE